MSPINRIRKYSHWMKPILNDISTAFKRPKQQEIWGFFANCQHVFKTQNLYRLVNNTSVSTFNMSATDPVHLRVHQHKADQPCTLTPPSAGITVSAPLVTASPSWDPDMRWSPPEVKSKSDFQALTKNMSWSSCFSFFVGYTQQKGWMSCTRQFPMGPLKGWGF